MPDANGRIKGISLSGVSNPWLDSLRAPSYHDRRLARLLEDSAYRAEFERAYCDEADDRLTLSSLLRRS